MKNSICSVIAAEDWQTATKPRTSAQITTEYTGLPPEALPAWCWFVRNTGQISTYITFLFSKELAISGFRDVLNYFPNIKKLGFFFKKKKGQNQQEIIWQQIQGVVFLN